MDGISAGYYMAPVPTFSNLGSASGVFKILAHGTVPSTGWDSIG